jgi:hypothetical protein
MAAIASQDAKTSLEIAVRLRGDVRAKEVTRLEQTKLARALKRFERVVMCESAPMAAEANACILETVEKALSAATGNAFHYVRGRTQVFAGGKMREMQHSDSARGMFMPVMATLPRASDGADASLTVYTESAWRGIVRQRCDTNKTGGASLRVQIELGPSTVSERLRLAVMVGATRSTVARLQGAGDKSDKEVKGRSLFALLSVELLRAVLLQS